MIPHLQAILDKSELRPKTKRNYLAQTRKLEKLGITLEQIKSDPERITDIVLAQDYKPHILNSVASALKQITQDKTVWERLTQVYIQRFEDAQAQKPKSVRKKKQKPISEKQDEKVIPEKQDIQPVPIMSAPL